MSLNVYLGLCLFTAIFALAFVNYATTYRPKPRFQIGDLVVINGSWAHGQVRYLAVKRRRWARMKKEERKQWLYNGPLYMPARGELVRAADDAEFSEKRLFAV